MPNDPYPRRDATMNVDVPLVQRLIAGQFPQWAQLAIRPVECDGWDNRTFRLGEDMAVRLPSAQAYAAQVIKEHRWLPRLARHLPLAIPTPIEMGSPAAGYPWRWSIYRWLEGESATSACIDDPDRCAMTLAAFLSALQRIDPAGGPEPGAHNFHRGGALSVYDAETRGAIAALRDRFDPQALTAVWDAALQAPWSGAPVWLHGDVSASNLLVRDGQFSAVIDFGCCGVGDPACDVTIAWTFFSVRSREVFRASLPVDEATWMRGRGWALWKALITIAEQEKTHPSTVSTATRVIEDVVLEHRHGG